MCDLFGLVTFGGGFLAAHQTLLLALRSTGHRWGPYHPPYVCRKAMLWRACKHLEWPEFPASIGDARLRSSVEAFLNKYSGPAPGSWEDVFTQEQIAKAVDALRARSHKSRYVVFLNAGRFYAPAVGADVTRTDTALWL